MTKEIKVATGSTHNDIVQSMPQSPELHQSMKCAIGKHLHRVQPESTALRVQPDYSRTLLHADSLPVMLSSMLGGYPDDLQLSHTVNHGLIDKPILKADHFNLKTDHEWISKKECGAGVLQALMRIIVYSLLCVIVYYHNHYII